MRFGFSLEDRARDELTNCRYEMAGGFVPGHRSGQGGGVDTGSSNHAHPSPAHPNNPFYVGTPPTHSYHPELAASQFRPAPRECGRGEAKEA